MNHITYHHRYFANRALVAAVLFFFYSLCWAMEVPIYEFSITAYSQNTEDYISPKSEDYTKSLLSPAYQAAHLKQFYNHYFATDSNSLSPWSKQMVLAVAPLIKKMESEILEDFNNQNKPKEDKHFAENFKEQDQAWWNKIRNNIDFYALTFTEFKEENRAIAVTNSNARALPEHAPDFYHASLPGQGFPFDNLQESAIWAGTPLYVFSVSKDKAWSLVLTPDGYITWIKSNDIAYVSPAFIEQWQQAAQSQMVAITQTEASVVDDHNQFQFTGYIGAVFPMIQRDILQTSILLPVKNIHNQAVIKTGIINTNDSSVMPLAASPKNLARIIDQLKNRPYGWGGVYFFNDCSQELKSLFTPFGIWLPRNSGPQAQLNDSLDLSTESMGTRIALLKEKGHPLMTLMYIGNHVMLYVGNQNDVAITYQNMWGMSPENRDKRYVIGQSLFLPLLKSFPENTDVMSQANTPVFKLIFLDNLNLKTELPAAFANTFSYVRTRAI